MALAESAGLDVRPWAKCKGGTARAAANPKYCYEWSFIQPRKLAVLNLWYDELPKAGPMLRRINMRTIAAKFEAKGSAAVQKVRALKMDHAIETAYRDRLPVRVILCDGDRRKVGSRTKSTVRKRLLDPSPWAVTFYNARTGDCIIRRDVKPIKVKPESVSRRDRLEKAAEEVLHRLRTDLRAYRVKLEPKVQLKAESDVDGFYVKLGSFDNPKVSLQIAIDNFYGKDRFWIGFSSEEVSVLRSASRSAEIKVYDRHCFESEHSKGKWRLRQPFQTSQLWKPVYEHYREVDKRGFYWGVYGDLADNVARQGADFFVEAFLAIANPTAKRSNSGEAEISEPFPNDEDKSLSPKKIIQVREIKRRNQKHVRALKKLYSCKCQITGNRYTFASNKSDYVEAHHLIPLGREGSDQLSNLILVSAHMHRMLHYAKHKTEIDLSKRKNGKLRIELNHKPYVIKWKPEHDRLVSKANTISF